MTMGFAGQQTEQGHGFLSRMADRYICRVHRVALVIGSRQLERIAGMTHLKPVAVLLAVLATAGLERGRTRPPTGRRGRTAECRARHVPRQAGRRCERGAARRRDRAPLGGALGRCRDARSAAPVRRPRRPRERPWRQPAGARVRERQRRHRRAPAGGRCQSQRCDHDGRDSLDDGCSRRQPGGGQGPHRARRRRERRRAVPRSDGTDVGGVSAPRRRGADPDRESRRRPGSQPHPPSHHPDRQSLRRSEQHQGQRRRDGSRRVHAAAVRGARWRSRLGEASAGRRSADRRRGGERGDRDDHRRAQRAGAGRAAAARAGRESERRRRGLRTAARRGAARRSRAARSGFLRRAPTRMRSSRRVRRAAITARILPSTRC